MPPATAAEAEAEMGWVLSQIRLFKAKGATSFATVQHPLGPDTISGLRASGFKVEEFREFQIIGWA